MSDDDEEPHKPHLKLASANENVTTPDEDRRLYDVEWATRELAANMIRVIRGAGRKYDLLDQVLGLHHSIRNVPKGTTVGQILGFLALPSAS